MGHDLRRRADGATIANRAWRCKMRCLECGAETAAATEVCAWRRAGTCQRFAAEGPAAGWAATEAIPARARPQLSESAGDSEPDGSILAEWVEAAKFSYVRLRRGYDTDQVDAFLDAIRNTFLGISGHSLIPDELRDIKFSATLLRPGYCQEEVDAFLDGAELTLAAQRSARYVAPAAGRPFVAAEPGAGWSSDPATPAAGGVPHQPAHRRPQSGDSWRDVLILVGLGLAPAGGPGGVTVAERRDRWQAIAWSLFGTFSVLPILGIGIGLSLPPGQHVLAAAVTLAGIAVVTWGCVWGCVRGWRMGVRLDDNGVTVRNFLGAHRFSWAEVRCFADGLIHETGQSGSSYFWALQVVSHDGRVLTAKGTARKKGARPKTLAAISQAAARHSVPAALTGIAMKEGSPVHPGLYSDPGGQPGLRHWDGQEWSPLLHADPDSGGPAKAAARAEVYSPLPGSQQQWHDAAARARRATAWSAVWLVVAAGAAVGTVALIAHNISRPSDDSLDVLAVLVMLTCLVAAWEAWKSRKKFRKIDRAAKASEVYQTPGQPRQRRR